MISAVGQSPPPFFKRGPAPIARLVFFVSLSLMLLVTDLHFHTLEWVRMGGATLVWPLQRIAHLPMEAGGDLGKYLTGLATLQVENEALRRRQLATAHRLLRQEHLEQENRRLRALIDMKEKQPAAGRIAEILYAARDPFSRRVIVDKGLREGVAAGQSVVDDVGVIGQITRVFPMTSEVTLLTDKDQAIPVRVERNGLRAVLAGAGAGNLELRFLAANADVRKGDTLVTSGLDGVYLPGLPVAKVVQIDRDNSFSFARIRCVPLAGVERHGHVLILGARIAPAPPDEPAAQAGSPPKEKRAKRNP
ncbi:MAG: rod shape-determining protein MreC [Candidatus Nitricoxidivorans perseverans]|uniref:Cell shape-determining protein MreC n=1 Tax=Candidatus Nitricoxidivorans perseverans TaxID=2975601 RepID=A0AA49FJU5_9PROT|nr:MAG: rod shape-determining protein MreC [Candidatus Nitricoxidivorans perseverans]